MVDDNNGKHRTVVFTWNWFWFYFEGDENNTLGGSDGNLESGGDYINVSQGGNYLITLDTRNNTYTIELVEDAWGVVGSATYSGWNGIDLKLVPDNCNDGTYVIFGVKLEPGQEIKFRQNDSWGNNYGDDNTDGTLEPGGANIPVPTYISYNIVLNINDNTYEISENATDGSNNSYDISLNSDLIGDVVTESALINAEVIYEGTSNYALSDSFTFYTNDGNEDSDLATVSISINPSNSNPVANDLQYSVQKNSSDNEIILIENDDDNYWFEFSANIVSQPSNGRVELIASENFVCAYTPNEGFVGTDSFTYKFSDGTGESETKTVKINVFNGYLSSKYEMQKINASEEHDGEQYGRMVAYSQDSNFIVVGAPSSGTGNNGNVKVYQRLNGSWTQIGQTLYGDDPNDSFGESVDITADGQTIIVGAPQNWGDSCWSLEDCRSRSDENRPGYIKVFEYNGTNWVQLGSKLMGENSGDSFGWRAVISADGSVIAGSSFRNWGDTTDDYSTATSDSSWQTGHVMVWKLNVDTWNRFGSDIHHPEKHPGMWFGNSLDMSPDGSKIVVGARQHDGEIIDQGSVTIFLGVMRVMDMAGIALIQFGVIMKWYFWYWCYNEFRWVNIRRKLNKKWWFQRN